MISIVIPFRGNEKELDFCLNSLIHSKLVKEILVGVDGDESLVESLDRSQANFEKITFYFFPNRPGISLILNALIDLTSGNYVARMDADDLVISERFELQKRFLDDNPDVDLVAGQAILKKSGEISKKKVGLLKCSDFLDQNPIIHPTIMFRRESPVKGYLVNVYRYNIKYRKSQDYELWTRLVRNWNFYNCKNAFILYNENYNFTRFFVQHLYFCKAMSKNYFYHLINRKCGCNFFEVLSALPRVISRLFIYPLKVIILHLLA